MRTSSKKKLQWIATMSEQGRITIPKSIRKRAKYAAYWIVRPGKKGGFEAIPLKD